MSFVLGMAILALTQILLSEKLVAKEYVDKELTKFYNLDDVTETVTNLALQKIHSKEWDGELANEYILSKEDVADIQDVINKNFLFGTKKELSITDYYSEPIENYCEELYEVTTDSNTDPAFLGYSCNKDGKTEVTIDFSVKSDKDVLNYTLTIEDLVPIVTMMGDAVTIDRTDMKVHLNHK